MGKWTTLTKLFIPAGVFLSLLWFNVGSPRCESPPGGPGTLPPQAKSDSTTFGKTGEQNWLADQEEKTERFQVLEWLIKQKLLSQYQEMEIREPLEDLPD